MDSLLKSETDQLKKLQDIVKKTIAEEGLIIENLINPPKEILTRGQKVSDKVAKFGGSWALSSSYG